MNNKEGGDKNMTVVVGSNWFSWHVLYPKTTTTQTRQHSRNDITHNHMKNKGGLSQAVDQHCTKKNNRQHISSRFQCVSRGMRAAMERKDYKTHALLMGRLHSA